MSAKQSLEVVSRTDIHKDRLQNLPRSRRKRPWKRALILLLRCLALFFVLASSASTRFFDQKPAVSPAFQPVGEIAIVTGPGFDACVAPPTDLLKTWWARSPYRWLNVYLGGTSMYPTCGGKNLTPEWVRKVYDQGWSLLPTWVGLQAPCARQHNVMSSDATKSYTQGQTEADAAIKSASRLGLSSTTPIYFDMEHFTPTGKNGTRDAACILAVNAFLNGWNNELASRSHLAGIYASASNYPMLSHPALTTSVMAWIAGGGSWSEKYDRTCTVYGNSYISDNDWNTHQRIYQYTGGHDETYGQKTWHIDSDCADAPMVGHITTTSVVLQFQHP